MASLAELIDSAAQIRFYTERRDRQILALRKAGHKWTNIAEAAGMSRPGVEVIARRENGGTTPLVKQQARHEAEAEAALGAAETPADELAAETAA
jgi:hypothetical protein